MRKKVKILHIIKSLGRGGAEMLLPETLKLHNQHKFEFHYIYFLPWKDQMVADIQSRGGKVICLPANNNIQLVWKFKQVKRYIEDNNIDLIHAHLPWAGFLSRMIHWAMDIPVIYTEHNKQERYHRVTYWLNRFSFNQQTKAIAVSNDVADSIRQNIRPKISITTVPNGVNTHYFQRSIQKGEEIRRKYDIPQEALVVGTVAVFRFQKRLEEWMEIFHQASQQNPHLYGIIVGDGPLKNNLLQKREKLQLQNKLLMPGLQTNTVDWFSAMDIFMMSSIFEGLPIALLEAMSMECAIASTNAGGIKEVIKDGISGVMADVDDWQKLSHHLYCLGDDNLRKTLAQNARLAVIDNFSLDKMVKTLEELYLNLTLRAMHE